MTVKDIIQKIDNGKYKAVIVEGYDGVGKGKILRELSDHYNVKPYRPDYGFWDVFGLAREDRWRISAYFWSVFNHYYGGDQDWDKPPMIFDRGVISGSVYNCDLKVALGYREILGDCISSVLHVLVTCSDEDYEKFYTARSGLQLPKEELYRLGTYTKRFRTALAATGVSWVEIVNTYDEAVSTEVCSSCGHYDAGVCRHPLKNNKPVDPSDPRCKDTYDKEVQDIE